MRRPFLQRLAIWSTVCLISAAPSFFFGYLAFSENVAEVLVGMILGIATFVLGYTYVTGTERFLKLKRGHFVARTLMIGYGARLLISVVYPIGAPLDMFCGVGAISFVGMFLASGESVLAIYLITLVQGVLLNLVLVLFLGLVYGFQRLFLPKPMPRAEHPCLSCGYDLRASTGVCPECGRRETTLPAAA